MVSGTTLNFYGGVDEIGGNKILLEDKGTRVLIDFGKSFRARSQYYDWLGKPRPANGVGDLLTLGILPEISGIYREDLLKLAGRAKEEKSVEALVLSHAHADHADYASFLREDIPIWMGETTRDVIESIEERRYSNIEFEITEFKKRPFHRNDKPFKRTIKTFKTASKQFSIDSIEFEPVHVDHSIPGCYGFIIRTSTSTIVYSGDLRMHGNRYDMTLDFIEKARESEPDLMLCEGTRINEPMSAKEEDVHAACRHFVEQARSSLVLADYSYKDVDRFQTFYKVAKETGRKLLINVNTARYLKRLVERNTSMDTPTLEDDTIAIYKPRKGSGQYDSSDYDKEDKEFYGGENVMTAGDVSTNQSKLILSLGSFSMDQLIDIKPHGGIYIHSSSEPFNEEGEVDEARIRKWLEKFDLERIHSHCSGHASGSDLNHIVNKIQPKTLVPIHTEHPNLFKMLHGERVRLPSINEEMKV